MSEPEVQNIQLVGTIHTRDYTIENLCKDEIYIHAKKTSELLFIYIFPQIANEQCIARRIIFCVL